jgi:hypothetical protein
VELLSGESAPCNMHCAAPRRIEHEHFLAQCRERDEQRRLEYERIQAEKAEAERLESERRAAITKAENNPSLLDRMAEFCCSSAYRKTVQPSTQTFQELIAQHPRVRGSGTDWPRAGKECLSVAQFALRVL